MRGAAPADEGWVAASSSLGRLPFGDGWAGTNEMDRTLPPLQVWVATLLGGGTTGARLASWLLGCLTLLIAGLATAHGHLRPVAGGFGVLLLAFWPSALAGSRWSVPWWEMSSYGRYDMAGMMCISLVALALVRFDRHSTASSSSILGVAAALGLCAHAMAVPVLAASGIAVALRDHRAATAEDPPPAPMSWAGRFSDGDRLFVDMKYQPLVEGWTAITPYFVMRWAMIPEDGRRIGERLSDWCPTWVVRGRDQWPFHLVRAEAGGPEIDTWLDHAVKVWEQAPINGFDQNVEVGRVDPAVCTERPRDR